MSNPSLSRSLRNLWTHSNPLSSSSFYRDQVKLNYAGNAFENQQKWGRIWWGSWMGIFAGFALLNGIQAHFDSGRKKPLYVVNTVKSSLGFFNLLFRPYPAFNVYSEWKEIRLNQHQTKTVIQQDHLRFQRVCQENRRRSHWWRHGSSTLVNLVGSAILYWRYNDPRGALQALALGLVASQVHIWGQPHSCFQEFELYKRLEH